jgi:hypothetical protein
MTTGAWNGRGICACVLAAALLFGLSACESGPDLERLAPKMPKLRTEVPESTHPEISKEDFPNINNAPDRPSVIRSASELPGIEQSLENDRDTHVKETVGAITGETPEEEPAAAQAETPAATTPAPSTGPLDITPAE